MFHVLFGYFTINYGEQRHNQRYDGCVDYVTRKMIFISFIIHSDNSGYLFCEIDYIGCMESNGHPSILTYEIKSLLIIYL